MNSTVTYKDAQYKCVREGLADILAPAPIDGKETQKTRAGGEEQSVFYNPIQTFNRDLSVLAAKVFAEEVVAERRASAHRQRQRQSAKKGEKRASNKRKRGEEGTVNGDESAEGTESAHSGVGGKKTRTDHDQGPAETAVEDVTNSAGVETEAMETDNVRESSGPATAGADAVPSMDSEPARKEKLIPFRILDALSATGLRALRYAKEIPESTLVTANDLSREAVEAIKRNIEFNGVQDKVHALQGNAAGHMYFIGTESKMPDGSIAKYDVIDLDPYGTAAPFLDAAVQSLSDGGMLAVTCTDSGVFASVGYLEKTYSQYGGLPWKGSQSHEVGLRLIIHAVATSAARYGLAIEPLLSLSIDYYVRIFIRIRKSPAEVKLLPGKTLTVYNCDTGCKAWSKQYHVRTTLREGKKDKFHHFTAAQGPTTTPRCEHCGFVTHIAGPMWGGYLHNPYFVQRLLDRLPSLDDKLYTTKDRLEGMLTIALHETILPADSSKDVENSEKTATNGSSQQTETAENSSNQEKEATTHAHKLLQRLDPALPEEHPFFIVPSELSKVLHTTSPKESALRGAFRHLGYRVTSSHTKPNTIRTDAPWSVIWDVMRAWVHEKDPGKVNAIKEGTAGFGIWKAERSEEHRDLEKSLSSFLGGNAKKTRAALAMIEAMKETEGDGRGIPSEKEESQSGNGEGGQEIGATETVSKPAPRRPLAMSARDGKVLVNFDEKLGADLHKGKLVRYQVNPRENWGPQSRAK